MFVQALDWWAHPNGGWLVLYHRAGSHAAGMMAAQRATFNRWQNLQESCYYLNIEEIFSLILNTHSH